MPETLTMNETPADQPELNADEQESLAIAEANEAEQQQLLAGKFKDAQSLEQAYLELQKKLGAPKEDVRDEEGAEETEAPEEVDEEEESSEEATLTQGQVQELFKMVGGEKAYQAMTKWAGDNLSASEIQMYDAVMGKGDPNAVFFAVQALNTRYQDAVGNDGELIAGRRSGKGQETFRSQQELVQAMSDPRYDSDPAYRQDVTRKLQNSDIQF
jgi:hypothetical protein